MSDAMKADTRDRIEDKLREGHRPKGQTGSGLGAVDAAAAQAIADGIVATRETFRGRFRRIEGTEWEPDWSLWRPKVYQHISPGLPQIAAQDHLTEDEPEGRPIRIAVIGDAHDSPHLPDKSRFEWMGAYIAEHQFEWVVSVGDWMTMDCFSTHTDRATFEGRAKPTFQQDIDSFHASQRAFRTGLGTHKPKLLITLGNHEHRAWRYDNMHPDGASHGMLVEEAFAQWGWRTSPYGEYRFIGGVGFTHIPLNARGKPQGVAQNRATAAMFDTIHGDDHRATADVAFKSGPVRSPTVYSAAAALPPGFIEGFANKGGSTWRSGICEATIWGNFVRKWSFTEMLLLRSIYGRKAAA